MSGDWSSDVCSSDLEQPVEKTEDSKPMEDMDDPKPSNLMENSEAESVLAAIEAKLDSETGSASGNTDSDKNEDAFERKIKSMQGGFHEVLMAKPAEKADSEETDPKTPLPVNNTNGEAEEEDDLMFPAVLELTEDEVAKKPPSSKKKKKSAKKLYAKAQKKKTDRLAEIANRNLEPGNASG